MRRGLLVLLTTISIGLGLSACDWPQFRLGPSHSGYNATENVIGVANVGSLVEKWHATEVNAVASSPAVVNGVVYVGASSNSFGFPDHNFYAYDAAGKTNCSGTPDVCSPLWTAQSSGFFQSSPAVVNGVVYEPADGDGLLHAYDAAGNTNCSGTPKVCQSMWNDYGAGGDPTVANGVVYANGGGSAFDASGTTNCSGSPKLCFPLWTISSDLVVAPISAAVDNGVVYTVERQSTSMVFNVAAFDANGVTNCSGTPKVCSPLWIAPIGGTAFSSPAVVNGVVYVQSVGSGLYAFDAKGVTNCSGTPRVCTPLWTALPGGTSSPAVANGVVYVGGSGDGNLYAFDAAGNQNCSGSPKTCAPLWTAHTGGAIDSSPAVANGVVYVGSDDHRLYAFDASGTTNCSGSPLTCAPLWSFTTGDTVTSSPAVANGMVYVGSWDDNLYAFGLP